MNPGPLHFDEGFLTRTLIPWARATPERLQRTARLLADLRRAEQRRIARAAELDVALPSTLVLSLTSRCQLRCAGCFAEPTVRGPTVALSAARRQAALRQAQALGVGRVALIGGEPLLAPDVDALPEAHPDLLFLVFTNGRALTEARAARLARAGNVIVVVNAGAGHPAGAPGPATLQALERAASQGLLTGFALTNTRPALTTHGAPEILDALRATGARFGLFFDYLGALGGVPEPHAPAGDADPCVAPPRRDAVTPSSSRLGLSAAVSAPGARHSRRGHLAELAPDPRDPLRVPADARAELVDRVRAWSRAHDDIRVVMAPEDEGLMGEGCGAAGREIVHVSAEGAIEPCPFVQRGAHHLDRHTLAEAITSDYFRALQAASRGWEESAGSCAYRAAPAEALDIIDAYTG